MELVFLFILLSLIIIITVILFFSKINIQIINLKFNSQKEKYLNEDYMFIVQLYVFDKVPLIKTRITKQKLEKINFKDKIRKIYLNELGKNIKFNKNIKKNIKKLDISIKEINLKINLGTENSAITSLLVPAISTTIAILLKKKIKNLKKQKFIVKPIYQNKNIIYLDISGIFEIKIVNIINIIYTLTRKGVNKYERTSNRRTYGYSYE